MKKEDIDLTLLLGKPIDSPETTAALANFDAETKVKIDKLAREPRWISKKAGVVIYSEKTSKRITTIFLYAKGEEGFEQYAGLLPQGLSFSMKQDQVKACFTTPPRFSNAERDTWDTEERRLVVRYQKTGAIARVSATTAF
jgi:hypothetical protein